MCQFNKAWIGICKNSGEPFCSEQRSRTMSVIKEQIKGTLETIRVVADAIRELGSVPSGHLYARLMSHMSHATYEKIIGVITRSGLVEEKNHLLTWIGPTEQANG